MPSKGGATVVGARATSASWVREKWTDEAPLSISEMNPAHAGMLLYLASVSKLSVGRTVSSLLEFAGGVA